MKLRRGRPSYKIPGHSQILSVYIEGNQRHNQMCAFILQHVAISDIPNPAKNSKPSLGQPTVCCVRYKSIEFFPIPDKSYVVKIRYVPPIMEF